MREPCEANKIDSCRERAEQAGSTVIAIPCYNDVGTLFSLLPRIRRAVPLAQIVVIDDGSQPPISSSACPGCTLIRQPRNLGLAEAVRTAARFAFSTGASGMVKIDADGEMDPVHLPKFVRALDAGADVVMGSFSVRTTPRAILRDDSVFRACYWLSTGRYPPSVLAEYRGFGRRAIERLIHYEGERYASPLHLFAMHDLRWTLLRSTVSASGGRRFPLRGMLDLRIRFLREALRIRPVVNTGILPVLALILSVHALYNLVFVPQLNGGRRHHAS